MGDRTLGAHRGLSPERAGAWLGKAAGTVGLGRSVAEDMTEREIAAHLAAAGRKPDAFDRAMDGIEALAAREAAERDRRQTDADVLVLACAVSERVDADSPRASRHAAR